MEIKLLEDADDDLLFWKKGGNIAIQKRITLLLASIQETPYTGIGKPEALKYDLQGKWSRRITLEDRLVYEIDEANNLIIVHS